GADPQGMAWYPPAMLLRRLPGGWNAFVVLGYVLAATLAFAYARTIGASRAAAAAGAVAFAAGGFLMGHLQHIDMVHTAAWLPLALIALERLRAEPGDRRWIAVLAAAVGLMILGGHPQVAVYGGGLLLA